MIDSVSSSEFHVVESRPFVDMKRCIGDFSYSFLCLSDTLLDSMPIGANRVNDSASNLLGWLVNLVGTTDPFALPLSNMVPI